MFRIAIGILGWLSLLAGLASAQTTDSASDWNPFLPEGSLDDGWPFIRGATFDGHSPEIHLAEQWPEAGPPILWRRDLGQGYSAFVAQGRRVLTQAQTLAGQVVICLDADSGQTLWDDRKSVV